MGPVFSGSGDTAVWMWRIKSPTKCTKERQNDVLIAFIVYVNDLSELQQLEIRIQKSYRQLQRTFQPSVALLRSSWRSCFMRAALFIMRATNSSLVFTFSLYTSLFIHSHRQSLICTRQIQTAVSSHPLKFGHMFIWTYLFGIVHTTTSKNIYCSSWNNLYIEEYKYDHDSNPVCSNCTNSLVKHFNHILSRIDTAESTGSHVWM